MTLVPCRECGSEISTQARTCPDCGIPDPAGSLQEDRPSKIRDEEDSDVLLTAVVATIAAYTLIKGVWSLVRDGLDYTIAGIDLEGRTDAGSSASDADDIRRIQSPEQNEVLVARSPSAHDRLREAATAGGQDRIRALLESDEVIPVDHGTRVEVLERGFNRATVVLKDGPYAGVGVVVPPQLLAADD